MTSKEGRGGLQDAGGVTEGSRWCERQRATTGIRSDPRKPTPDGVAERSASGVITSRLFTGLPEPSSPRRSSGDENVRPRAAKVKTSFHRARGPRVQPSTKGPKSSRPLRDPIRGRNPGWQPIPVVARWRSHHRLPSVTPPASYRGSDRRRLHLQTAHQSPRRCFCLVQG